jgi:UDPglucose 6-dehydrogenase
VGLVTGTCLAEVGNDVLCLDVDPAKIKLLEDGGIPIYEPGLQEMVRRNVAAGRLHFSNDLERAAHFGTIMFIAVGTPPGEDGSADMQYVTAAARNIGKYMTDYKVVVDKSTVPVGTARVVKATIVEELGKRGVDTPFSVVSNPEFLKEGAAIEDFMKPDRIVVGCDDEQAMLYMRALYAPFQRNHDRLIVMDVCSAELTKYAANAMLATRISFMNELANLAEKLGADIESVREATSREVIKDLLAAGATVTAYDPVAMAEAQRCFVNKPGLSYAASQTEALANADALVIVTEWKEFRSPDFAVLKATLKTPVIFDDRNPGHRVALMTYRRATLTRTGRRQIEYE